MLVLIILIPVSFASSDGVDNITEAASDNVEMEMIAINESEDTQLETVEKESPEIYCESGNNSYFTGDNENIEEPIIDDAFASPSIRYTDKNTFYVNASYNGSSELGTVNSPFKNINSAVSALSINRSVVNIYVAEGVYEVSKTISLTKTLNIIGENPLNTIIDAKNTHEILLINKNNLAVNIINFTFLAGNTYYGGAIYNNRSSVKLINTIFKNNMAVGQDSYSAAGGALYNEGGTFKIYNSTFINNKAKSSLNIYGAAIYNDLGTLSILNSKFINNTISDGNYGCGGAIYNFNGFLTVFNTTFKENEVDSNYSIGGAIYSYESHNVYVINCTFDGNRLFGNYTLGSAIANSAILLEVVNSTVCNNLANGTALENSTICNINGYYNFINSSCFNNTIKNPKKYLLLCLEDQFIISRVYDDELLNNLPSKYDLRELGLVTGAKNQGSSGACWAFTTIAALESFLLKYENISYDFSENNLKNLMNYRGENGTDWADGGNYQMALAYFLRWDGPIDEDDDYFSAYSTIPNYDLIPLKHVQGAMYVPIRLGYLDNDQIKYAIMKYGAVYTSIYGTSMTKNMYNSFAEIPNHAVTIVGWDDDYPASKFSGTKPPANGAFIIKNSWGTSYGEKGFGYVSYYDKTLAGFSLDSLSVMAFTNVENITNFKDIYQYDILGNTYESVGYGNNTAWLANQFTAVSNNPLSAFGLYTYGASDYLVDIFVNGDLKYSQEGNVAFAGFHTIKLNELVNLSKGDVFRINVRLTTFDSLFPIAVESQRSGYSSKATASLNQSFISPDGINWFDIAQDFEIVKVSGCLYNKTISQANVCLKAYTENVGELILDVISNSTYFYNGDEIKFTFNLTNFGDYVKDINVSVVLDKIINVVYSNCSKGVFVNNIFSVKELYHGESAILELTVKVLGFNDFVENIAIVSSSSILKNNGNVKFNLSYGGFTKFIVKNVTSFSKSGEIINVSLLDSFSNPVSNVDVLVNYNGDNITFKTNEYGIFEINLNLTEGNYIFNVYFNGEGLFNKSNSTFKVKIIKRESYLRNIGGNSFYYPNAPSVILTDGDNVKLTNKTVKLQLFEGNKNLSFNILSNDLGVLSLFNIPSGNYNVICLFEGDDYYNESQCRFNISVIKKSTLLTSKSMVTNAVIVKVDGKTGPYLKVYLKDIGSNALSNKQIKVKLNSRNYNLITNKQGIAVLQINIAKAGKYTAKISFSGDDGYCPSSISTKITVKKKKTSLKVSKKTYKLSKKVKKLTAKLIDNKGRAISNKKIIFKVKGKKYTSKTNKRGIATVKVKVYKKKSYKVNVSFKGDSSYCKSGKNSRLVIK